MTIDNLKSYFSGLVQTCKFYIAKGEDAAEVKRNYSFMGEGALHLYLSIVPYESIEAEEAWKAWREFQYSIFCNSL